MNAFTTIDEIETDEAFGADVPDVTGWDGMSALCDMDGYTLVEGQMVQVSGMTGWYEIDTIKPGSRRVEVFAPDGALLDVLASEVAINGI
jgi:hypothetical protein